MGVCKLVAVLALVAGVALIWFRAGLNAAPERRPAVTVRSLAIR